MVRPRAARADLTTYTTEALLDRARRLRDLQPWEPLPHQVVPESFPARPGEGWLLLGGRGSGKTDACAAYFDRYMTRERRRGAIIAPTIGDAVESCIRGPSGLEAHNPRVRLRMTAGGLKVVWPNGSEAKLFGTNSPDDIERLRAGGNRELAWLEELAAWRYLDEGFEHMEYGLRTGTPHWVGSTTPKPRKLIKRLVGDPSVTLSRAETKDNPHLPERIRERLYTRYAGTRLGRQELRGELLEDVPGALWTHARIDELRVDVPAETDAGVQPLAPVDLVRVVVAVDPAASNTDDSDETGVIAAGLGVDGHGYVLHDGTLRGSPTEWGRRAVGVFDYCDGDLIVGEVNNGGDMVEHVVRTVRASVPFRQIRATRGKIVRAEPVSALYEQGRVHHVGSFPELEDQLSSFVPTSLPEYDDRADALVYALTELMIGEVAEDYIIVQDERAGFEISPY